MERLVEANHIVDTALKALEMLVGVHPSLCVHVEYATLQDIARVLASKVRILGDGETAEVVAERGTGYVAFLSRHDAALDFSCDEMMPVHGCGSPL